MGVMPTSIRAATMHNLVAIVDPLIEDTQQRVSFDPRRWRLAADARARIVRAAAALD
jgi:hypothetical protein